MRGTMLIFKPHEASPTVLALSEPPRVADLQRTVGGYIEVVPGFDTIDYESRVRGCVAFCNEDGKLNGLATNDWATLLWDRALRRAGGEGFLLASGRRADSLVGPVAVIFGDKTLMRAV